MDLGVIEYPEFADRPEVVGVFVGGCVARGVGSRFRRQAHAHNSRRDKHFGWICVLTPRRLYTASGKPSQLMIHELAHMLTPNHGHDDAWRAKMREIGGTIRAHERKKVRA
jgi:hypothetical protein